MNKRGISNLIVIMLFIILIILSLILLYNVTKFFLQEEGEISEIKAELVNTQMSVRTVEGDLILPTTVNVTISIDKGLESIKNINYLNISQPADIFLLADVSGSMDEVLYSLYINQSYCQYKCTYPLIPGTNSTSYPNNWTQAECYLPYINRADCKSNTDVCNKGAATIQPNSNSTAYINTMEQFRCRYYYNYTAKNYTTTTELKNMSLPRTPECKINISTQSCAGKICPDSKCDNTNGSIFFNYTYINKTIAFQNIYKIGVSKDAAKNFTDVFLNFSGNQMGIITFSTAVEKVEPLSSNANSLKTSIDKWKSNSSTCICCAINEAIPKLTNQEHIRALIIITDGTSTEICNPGSTGDPQKDSIKAAATAFANGIKVYTIGFSLKSNTEELNKTAQAGGGQYYDASNASGLADAFTDIVQQISKEYQLLTDLEIAVVFSNEKESYKYMINNPPERIHESKKYSIDIPPGAISDIKKIEIYPVLYTKAGREIVGPLLSIWTAPS